MKDLKEALFCCVVFAGYLILVFITPTIYYDLNSKSKDPYEKLYVQHKIIEFKPKESYSSLSEAIDDWKENLIVNHKYIVFEINNTNWK
jgi:hypothetical protein